ncbi:MAG: alpha/beta fold hydrolase [Planctomycetota bacterium]
MVSIFRSEAGRRAMADWYERFLRELSFECDVLQVDTSLGPTRVLRSGPEEGTPLVVLHGALAGAPHALGEFGAVPGRYRTYAVDLAGQSVHAPETRPDVRTDEYGVWLLEVLDALGLDRVVPCAASWGGFVALNLAVQAPERIAGLVLVVPAGVVRSPALLNLREVAWPMLRYRLGPRTEARRDAAFAGLLTEPHPMWSPFLEDAMRHVRIDFKAPPVLSDDRLRTLTSPVLAFGAAHDVSFPGRELVERVARLWPENAETELLDCKHVPPFDEAFRSAWSERVDRFLVRRVGL